MKGLSILVAVVIGFAVGCAGHNYRSEGDAVDMPASYPSSDYDYRTRVDKGQQAQSRPTWDPLQNSSE